MERYLVGTYTRENESKGIYYMVLNTKTGKYKIVSSTKREVENPLFFTLNKEQDIIYAITKDNESGGIGTYIFEDDRFWMHEAETIEGLGACSIILTPNEDYVLTGHYGAGKIVVNKVDGTYLEGKPQIIDHKEMEKDGQQARVHFIEWMGDGHVLVCDLGLDALFVYPFDEETGLLDVEKRRRFDVPLGSGPRNTITDKKREYVYCINEYSLDVMTFRYQDGELTYIGTFPALEETNPKYSGAAIKMSPDEKYLYTSIRGANVLAVYEMLGEGQLKHMTNVPVEGDHPRDIELSINGDKLFAANQFSNDVTVFTIDANGVPQFTGEKIELPSPVCVVALQDR